MYIIYNSELPYFIDMARIPNPNKQLTVGQGVPLIFNALSRKKILRCYTWQGLASHENSSTVINYLRTVNPSFKDNIWRICKNT